MKTTTSRLRSRYKTRCAAHLTRVSSKRVRSLMKLLLICVQDDNDVYILTKVSDVLHSIFSSYREQVLPWFEQLLQLIVNLIVSPLLGFKGASMRLSWPKEHEMDSFILVNEAQEAEFHMSKLDFIIKITNSPILYLLHCPNLGVPVFNWLCLSDMPPMIYYHTWSSFNCGIQSNQSFFFYKRRSAPF